MIRIIQKRTFLLFNPQTGGATNQHEANEGEREAKLNISRDVPMTEVRGDIKRW